MTEPNNPYCGTPNEMLTEVDFDFGTFDESIRRPALNLFHLTTAQMASAHVVDDYFNPCDPRPESPDSYRVDVWETIEGGDWYRVAHGFPHTDEGFKAAADLAQLLHRMAKSINEDHKPQGTGN